MLSDPATLEEHLGILKKIEEAINLNVSELDLAYSQRSLSTVAWLARNLLELVIWSEHCAASKENAKEFFLDGARDTLDVMKIPEGPWLRNSLEPNRQRLLDKAAADGFDIEQDYARVSQIARSLGRGGEFKHYNKTLSKFAHPTALVVFSAGIAPAAQEALRKNFYELGIHLGDWCVRFLNEAVHRISTQIQSETREV